MKATRKQVVSTYSQRISELIPRHPPYGQHNLREWLLLQRPENLSVAYTEIWREEVDKVTGGIENNAQSLF